VLGYSFGFQHFAYFPFRHVLLHPYFAVDYVEVQRAVVYKPISFPADRDHLIAVVFFIGNEFVAAGDIGVFDFCVLFQDVEYCIFVFF